MSLDVLFALQDGPRRPLLALTLWATRCTVYTSVPDMNPRHAHHTDLSPSHALPHRFRLVTNPTADFSMLDWIHGLTGSSDRWRCVSRTACLLEEYLRPCRHLADNEDRTTEVVSEQWHLAIWTFAAWAASYGRSRIAFFDGEAFMSCHVCKTLVPLANGDAMTTGVAHCTNVHCSPEPLPLYVLHPIAKTPFDGALNAARTACGGVRGYPLLRGMSSRLQLPVLHCTGNLAKVIIYFILACLPESVGDEARSTMLAISGKGKIDALYLREFRELVAHTAAQPSIFSRDLDVAFVIMLQLCQLLNASWRASLADEKAAVRNGATDITRLCASILGPLYQEIKPLDPETKDAKVLSLYLHAPIAHLHHQVGLNRDAVAFVSDDLIEGHVRGIGRYTQNHGNNTSQAALMSDLAGLCEGTVKFSTPRSHPSSLIFTKHIHVCSCWKTLGVLGSDDFAALATIGEESSELSVEHRADGEELVFTLPLHDHVDENKAKRLDPRGKPLTGKKEALRRGLRRRQGVIRACICGRLTGQQRSQVTDLARKRQVAARLRVAQDKQAAAATGGPSGGLPGGSSGGLPGRQSTGAAAVGGSIAEADDDSMASASEVDDMASTAGSDIETAAADTTTAGKAKGEAMSVIIKRFIPAAWLLRRCIPLPTAFAAVVSDAPEEVHEPPLPVVDAALRKHITILQILLMRTKTREFGRWATGAKVQPADMIEAVRTVLDRLLAARTAILPLLDESVVMEM